MSDKADDSSSAEVYITFKVKASGEKNHQINMAESATVLDLKTKLASDEYENIPVERQRLIYSGRVMKNDETLAFYKVKAGNTIHLVKSAASNPPPAPNASSSQPAVQAIPTNMAAGTTANNILAGLTGARFAGHANLPSINMFGADGGMGAPPTEDQMADMLANPNIAQAMNEALNNPQMVDLMIQSSPMLRNNPNAREIIQSPFFRSMLTNPDTLRAVAQMRRAMGSGAGGEAFPAPGLTNTSPAADAEGGSHMQDQQNPQFPFMMPGVFGGAPGAEAAAGGQAANPFAALFNPFGTPAAAVPQTGFAAQTPSSDSTAHRDASASASASAPAPAPADSTPAGQPGYHPTSTPPNPFAGFLAAPQRGPANPFGLTPEMMQNFMQMMGGMPAEPAAPADARPPEERYADQLRQLNEMGFYDFEQNVSALRRSGGDVQGAVNFLLGG